ncbi:MAG: hypothetical protein Q9159_003580 [Coniocarpon cinnabarinum]
MSHLDHPQHLQPSELGTKSHWDYVYTSELENHASDSTDEGTVWFEESGAEERVIAYLADLPLPSHARPSDQREEFNNVPNEARVDLRILDVGTGNGHMLFALREEGWKAQLVGVDYAAASVRLARQIASTRERESSEHRHSEDIVEDEGLRFDQCDILGTPSDENVKDGFDVVLDKGTFDAISLTDELVDETGQTGSDVYAERISKYMREDAFLIVVSCNWTNEELVRWFTGASTKDANLKVYGTVHFPTFEFGGLKGQAVSCVCFQKKQRSCMTHCAM